VTRKLVRKAVVVAGGFGTRFLPQTKAIPKEMLPLIDKPIIQYIVEELVDAGIKDIIIVTSANKRSIEDHFDTANEDLLNSLRSGGASKQPIIDELQRIADLANFIYVRQKGPRGLAGPLLNVAPLIDDEPFIYALADDIAIARPNYFRQMIEYYDNLQGSILPCIKIDNDDELRRYGIIGGDVIRDDVLKMSRIIEKPDPAKAPSHYASVLGYVLTPDVFEYAERNAKLLPANAEFQITDHVIQPMLDDGIPFYGCEIKNSQRYDTGNKLDYLKTVIDFALLREDIGPQLRAYLRNRLG